MRVRIAYGRTPWSGQGDPKLHRKTQPFVHFQQAIRKLTKCAPRTVYKWMNVFCADIPFAPFWHCWPKPFLRTKKDIKVTPEMLAGDKTYSQVIPKGTHKCNKCIMFAKFVGR